MVDLKRWAQTCSDASRRIRSYGFAPPWLPGFIKEWHATPSLKPVPRCDHYLGASADRLVRTAYLW